MPYRLRGMLECLSHELRFGVIPPMSRLNWLFLCLCWAFKSDRTLGKCVKCCGLLISSVNPPVTARIYLGGLHLPAWLAGHSGQSASLVSSVGRVVAPLTGWSWVRTWLGWPFISHHLILVCVNYDLNGSLRINSRLHARLNNQLSLFVTS